MRAILVTGATTPLGALVIRRLLERGDVDHVVATGKEESPPHLIGHRNLTYVHTDLTREREVRRLLFGPVRELGVEAVVHTAQHRAAKHTGGGAHRLNVDATRFLLRLAEQHPTIRHFAMRSDAAVYTLRAKYADVIREDQKLELSPTAPQWIRDRVEADVACCARMGLSHVRIVVLRCAEILADGTGSQLWDYLSSRACLRPMGFDPMLHLLSTEDAARALRLALLSQTTGAFNIPGRDVLPLSAAIRKWGCRELSVPGPLLGPLYAVRARLGRGDFDYRLNQRRFHHTGVLDGTRAREQLGYVPEVGIDWPRPEAARAVFTRG